jgi:hypothetical protein
MIGDKMTNTNDKKLGTAEEYFLENSKFFGVGDVNGKKAFFMLGNYTRKVMECQEKQVAEDGKENKFSSQVTRLATSNMTYRVFTTLTKRLS